MGSKNSRQTDGSAANFDIASPELVLLRLGLRRFFVFLFVCVLLLFLLLPLQFFCFPLRRLMRWRGWRRWLGLNWRVSFPRPRIRRRGILRGRGWRSALRWLLICGWPIWRYRFRFWRWGWARLIARAFSRLCGWGRLRTSCGWCVCRNRSRLKIRSIRRSWRGRRRALRWFFVYGWPLRRYRLRFWRWTWARLIVRAFNRLWDCGGLIVHRLVVRRRPIVVRVGSRGRSSLDDGGACGIGACGGLTALRSNSGADDGRRGTWSYTGPNLGRRRCDTGDHSGLRERNGWSGGRRSNASCGRNVAGASGSKGWCSLNHAHGLELLGCDTNGRGLDWPGADKRFSRDSSDGTGIIRVGVVHAVDRHVVDHRGGVVRVVNVSDLRDVDYSRVGDVDVLNVRRTGVVRGQIHIARAKREPGHAGESATESHRNSSAAGPAANEADERGRIHRADRWRAGNPSPVAAADQGPSTVVEWRKAPRLRIDPGPTPGRDPNPMAVVIGSPADHNVAGNPDWPIFRIVLPVTVVVEIIVAIHVA